MTMKAVSSIGEQHVSLLEKREPFPVRSESTGCIPDGREFVEIKDGVVRYIEEEEYNRGLGG